MPSHLPRVLAPLALAAVCFAADAGLPDPTRPLSFTATEAPVATGPVLRLEAVMRSGNNPVAIVNGKLVRVGDHVDGATIAGIDSDSLRYVSGGHEHVARLSSSTLKVRRAPEGVTP